MPKNRVQIDLTDAAKTALLILQTKAKKASMRETIVSAIALYELVLDQQASGGEILLRKGGKTEVLRIL